MSCFSDPPPMNGPYWKKCIWLPWQFKDNTQISSLKRGRKATWLLKSADFIIMALCSEYLMVKHNCLTRYSLPSDMLPVPSQFFLNTINWNRRSIQTSLTRNYDGVLLYTTDNRRHMRNSWFFQTTYVVTHSLELFYLAVMHLWMNLEFRAYYYRKFGVKPAEERVVVQPPKYVPWSERWAFHFFELKRPITI